MTETSVDGESAPLESRSSVRLWVSLSVFIALTVTLATRHEMWRDEVRAFSVAIRAPAWGSMLSSLHQEGHPALWYVVLRIGYALTHSNLVLPISALIVSAIVAYTILRFAPFPFWLRLLAVFGAFLGYELTVVARNYGIGVLFMILACVSFPSRRGRPWLLGICLALMANTSVHAALAALVILFIWLTDLFDAEKRRQLTKPVTLASLALVVAGVAFSFVTARPTPEMAWAFSVGQIDAARIARTILTDPGLALAGVQHANVAAAGEFPWRFVGIDPAIPSRIIVDACLLWLAWSLRKRPWHLSAMVVAVIGFEVLFREVYSGALRHEGVIAFLLFAIAWLAVVDDSAMATRSGRRKIAFGLLPLLAVQSAALPFVAWRYFNKPESGSKAYGQFLASHPKYRSAILMSEPDYMMEAMPYYAANRIYMPRQNEFHHRVYFDRGRKRLQDLSLTRLMYVADSVSCVHQSPVLLALGYTGIAWQKSGIGRPVYKGAVFRWNELEWALLRKRAKPVASFPEATSDEIYHIVEMDPVASGRCF